MVSCRCTREMTRLFRARSNRLSTAAAGLEHLLMDDGLQRREHEEHQRMSPIPIDLSFGKHHGAYIRTAVLAAEQRGQRHPGPNLRRAPTTTRRIAHHARPWSVQTCIRTETR